MLLNTRAIASLLIFEVLENKRSLTQELPKFKAKCKTEQDAAFVQALAFGVIRWLPRLQFTIEQLMPKPLKAKDHDVLYLIMIGIYQLSDMRVTEYSAVSECVEATKQINKSWAASLVNAVLRNYQRNTEKINVAIQNNEAAHYAHPKWLIKTLKIAWENYWQEILNANNQAPPLSLRVNLRKVSREDYLAQLLTESLEATIIPETKTGIIVNDTKEITKLPGFAQGFFSVQDAAAQFAAELLQLTPNLHILDACAAPGGKTTHLLEEEPSSNVIAIDISADRLRLVSENLNRLQLSATIKAADAANPSIWWDKRPFDRILLDAPCSGTGVIRRHPDIKSLRKPNDIAKMVTQQQNLLIALWPLLKKGGILLYVTCSILPEENVVVMKNFLNQHSDAQVLPFTLPCGIEQTIGYQLLPGQNNMDGFYYARLQKI